MYQIQLSMVSFEASGILMRNYQIH